MHSPCTHHAACIYALAMHFPKMVNKTIFVIECVTDYMTTYVTDNMTTYVTYLGIILVYNLVVV